ncbi:type I-F CRISPR-associated protein Csy2 [Xanthomonas fragariae]|uniref:CRISPR-associated protein Csy2 n=2 Tax=Xanthomonas fragariae TaxID=48664 RepID=A0A1Y6HQ67_9XANT|nr:type I-F CRISPR-associated protein Csy2 [Xanthomonas fragariae]AOD16020.1 type I-F CRISPR-associated protein Csy2 [Xanthomonas fragariae]AOD19446.1 type I-F CRISPR-associated protein Csy2 [Xanthomonas fragariae]ENZ96951.1 crispr-associated protein, Csy2 family [Xanthomonas fragariae LMG 25863]MBL9197335.1 type I-F CRISPR-associated protein Csy2 [Xanthomonas fragariae]MBL9222283.1 type I-F CRISPR-associated protein Csy2 [Xanthomonas fragariae]
MSRCPAFSHLLVLPHLHVHNANAVSSPLTHGFPSMTALLGLMWALQRKVHAAGLELTFHAIGAVCHAHQEQVTEGGFVKAFHLTRNPIGKDGKTAPIVEEGRIHLELSLVLGVHSQRWSDDPPAQQADTDAVAELLAGMRIAGGSLRAPAQPWRHRYQPWTLELTGTEDDRTTQFRKARMRLLPGFALVERADLLDARLAELQATDPGATRLDAWLSLSRINWRYQSDTTPNDTPGWSHDRSGHGWTVPIPVGYGALGELQAAGSVANARDTDTAFRFVESLYSLGQWISPHRLDAPQQLLWYASSDPGQGLYRCRNDFAAAVIADQTPDSTFSLD